MGRAEGIGAPSGTGPGGAGTGPGATGVSARRERVRRLTHRTPTDRRADTQRRLLDAGRRVIAEHGVGGASVGLVTAEAGFTRGAFYSNFTDMDHFVAQVAAREWDTTLATVRHRLAEALSGDGPAHEDAAGRSDAAPGAGVGAARRATARAVPDPAPGAGAGSRAPGPGTERTQDRALSPIASHIAASLASSTRGLFEAVPASVRGLDGEERLAVLARALLAAVPRDRDFHLLWTSLANVMVRDPEGSPALRESFHGFRAGMAAYLVEALAALGLEPRMEALDIVDLVIAVGSRSTRARLIGEDEPGHELLDRVLPHLLPVVVRPVPGTRP